MAKDLQISLLLDFYGEMLTDKQREMIEFYYNEESLKIYMNKQNSNATFDAQFDGKIVDVVEAFYYNKKVNILEIDGKTEDSFLAVRLEQGNAYYQIMAELKIDVVEEIIRGIFFENV